MEIHVPSLLVNSASRDGPCFACRSHLAGIVGVAVLGALSVEGWGDWSHRRGGEGREKGEGEADKDSGPCCTRAMCARGGNVARRRGGANARIPGSTTRPFVVAPVPAPPFVNGNVA